MIGLNYLILITAPAAAIVEIKQFWLKKYGHRSIAFESDAATGEDVKDGFHASHELG